MNESSGNRDGGSRKLTVLDLFAGCGGFSQGFNQAGGFEVVGACQWDAKLPAIARTYQVNHPGALMVNADIRLPETKEKIYALFADKPCDVTIGGPSCVAYSTSGKRDPNDPRARLFEDYLEIVGRLKPAVAVMENVRALLSVRNSNGGFVIDEMVSGFRQLGYQVGHKVLNAADYGVPQRRNRVFIIAARAGIPIRFPDPTHAEHPGLSGGRLPWVSIRDAIGDLAHAPEDKASWHVFTRHSPEVAARFAGTPIGKKGLVNYHEGYYRNPPDKPSVTIKTVAWPIHYIHPRELTCREAARVQSFPDSFRFVGGKTAVATMIGNAVPPALAKAVASAVYCMLGNGIPPAEPANPMNEPVVRLAASSQAVIPVKNGWERDGGKNRGLFSPTIIDLFAGSGGMSLGFKMAGFNVPVANEVDEWAGDTYEANHPGTRLIRGDIRSISDWPSLLGGIKDIAGVVGGPCCQGFSLSGRRDPKDPRNSLFMDFARCVSEVQPRFFVMENVPGILSMRTVSGDRVAGIIISKFDSMGYEVDYSVLNAADFGVPQSRRRVFFVGFRKGALRKSWSVPAHGPGAQQLVTVDMAISDLPRIAAGEGSDEQPYPVPPQNAYQEWARAESRAVFNHVAMRHTGRLVERFKVIAQGQSVADVPEEHSAAKRGNPTVKSGKVYGQNNMRVRGDRPVPTVAASFQSNFIHPVLNRNFTAREGARLQSFPDTYVFKGARTAMSWEKRLSQYKQIGNAVPPLMAKAVGLAVLEMLGESCPVSD